MEFRFEPKVTAQDMWKLTMRHTYKSMIGVCNVIFAVAVILLTAKFWSDVDLAMKIFLGFCCILFPVMQPVSIYLRSVKQVKTLPDDLVVEFDDAGVHVTGNRQCAHTPWPRVRGLIREKDMLILALDGGRGYMLTNRILGQDKDNLANYVESRLVKKS